MIRMVVAILLIGSAQNSLGQTLSIGTVTYVARRAAVFDGVVGTGSGTFHGAEIAVQTRYVGFIARTFGARIEPDSQLSAAGRLTYGDVRLTGGPPVLSGELGIGRRALAGALSGRSWSFARLGLVTNVPIGDSGLIGKLGLGWYVNVSGSGDFTSARGGDLYSRLTYVLPMVPVYAALGLRIERFTVTVAEETRAEETTAIFLGAGIRLSR